MSVTPQGPHSLLLSSWVDRAMQHIEDNMPTTLENPEFLRLNEAFVRACVTNLAQRFIGEGAYTFVSLSPHELAKFHAGINRDVMTLRERRKASRQ